MVIVLRGNLVDIFLCRVFRLLYGGGFEESRDNESTSLFVRRQPMVRLTIAVREKNLPMLGFFGARNSCWSVAQSRLAV